MTWKNMKKSKKSSKSGDFEIVWSNEQIEFIGGETCNPKTKNYNTVEKKTNYSCKKLFLTTSPPKPNTK